MNEFLLVGIAFCTSLVTAIFGLGGGLILIAVMPGLLPVADIIPIHAVTQLTSNLSRAAFGWRQIHWELAVPFLVGAIPGGWIAAQFATLVSLNYLPLLIAAFILFNVWGSGLKFKEAPRGELFTIGFLQTGLGMLVGATGPLGQSTLVRKGLARDALVVTSAILIMISHLIKLLLFGLLGFSFAHYWPLILGMSLAVVGGSWVGTRMRQRVPDQQFQWVLKWLLTLLAFRMIYTTLLG